MDSQDGDWRLILKCILDNVDSSSSGTCPTLIDAMSVEDSGSVVTEIEFVTEFILCLGPTYSVADAQILCKIKKTNFKWKER
jgi:hypothetical protein